MKSVPIAATWTLICAGIVSVIYLYSTFATKESIAGMENGIMSRLDRIEDKVDALLTKRRIENGR